MVAWSSAGFTREAREKKHVAEPQVIEEPGGKNRSPFSVQDLHVWFELRRFGFGRAGYVRAVDGVSFACTTAKRFAVVGESGCGSPA
jgi:peptide/nickel transport system ATP-binding protein